MGQNPRSIVGNEKGATAYKTRNSPYFRDAVKLHDVDEFGKAKPTIHIKRNKAGETLGIPPRSVASASPPYFIYVPLFSSFSMSVPKKGGGSTDQLRNRWNIVSTVKKCNSPKNSSPEKDL